MNFLFLIFSIHTFLLSFPNFLLSFFPEIAPMDPNEMFFNPNYLPTTTESKLLLVNLMRLVNGLVIGYAFLYFLIAMNPSQNRKGIYVGGTKKYIILKTQFF